MGSNTRTLERKLTRMVNRALSPSARGKLWLKPVPELDEWYQRALSTRPELVTPRTAAPDISGEQPLLIERGAGEGTKPIQAGRRKRARPAGRRDGAA